MNTAELFLIATVVIFSLPYLVRRLGRTDHHAPLVMVQILTGIVLGARGAGRCVSRRLPLRPAWRCAS